MIDVIRLLRPYLIWLLPLAVLAALAAVAETVALISIVPLAKIVADGNDSFAGTIGPFDIDLSIDQLLGIAAVSVLASLVFSLLSAFSMAKLIATYLYRERMGLWDRYLNARWEQQSAEREGRLQTHNGFVTSGAQGLSQLSALTVAGVSVLVMVVAAFTINPVSTLIMIGLGSVVVSILIPINRHLKHLGRHTSRARMSLGETISEVSTHTLDFRVFGSMTVARRLLEKDTRRVRNLERRAATIRGVVTPAYRTLGLLVVLALLFIGSRQADLNVAGFGAIALLLLRSLGYGSRLQNSVGTIIGAVGPLEQLEETRRKFGSAAQRFGDETLGTIEDIELRRLAYVYPDADAAAVRDVDLSLRRGEVVGLAGPSGSGKTTLSHALVRLREPTGGQYLVNGRDARDYDVESWTGQVALVPQAPALFHGTVRDNISVYRETVDEAAITAAARAAGIHETISALPDGYDTAIGATLRNLSGGQVQRIGIARALAGRPSLLILDEPTSALDVATEGFIQETLERIRGELTIVVIAHRLTTLTICDRIVELDNGRIVRVGPTEQILPGLETAHLG
ncbi:MAG: ABC transporter ATP-binding protein [Acidimicrobiales bacterium]